MKLAEHCNTTTSYIGHIETGLKFPSMDMIEKIAEILRIEPYLFFINRMKQDAGDSENTYPQLPRSLQSKIRSELNFSINELIRETLEKY